MVIQKVDDRYILHEDQSMLIEDQSRFSQFFTLLILVLFHCYYLLTLLSYLRSTYREWRK